MRVFLRDVRPFALPLHVRALQEVCTLLPFHCMWEPCKRCGFFCVVTVHFVVFCNGLTEKVLKPGLLEEDQVQVARHR